MFVCATAGHMPRSKGNLVDSAPSLNLGTTLQGCKHLYLMRHLSQVSKDQLRASSGTFFLTCFSGMSRTMSDILLKMLLTIRSATVCVLQWRRDTPWVTSLANRCRRKPQMISIRALKTVCKPFPCPFHSLWSDFFIGKTPCLKCWKARATTHTLLRL